MHADAYLRWGAVMATPTDLLTMKYMKNTMQEWTSQRQSSDIKDCLFNLGLPVKPLLNQGCPKTLVIQSLAT